MLHPMGNNCLCQYFGRTLVPTSRLMASVALRFVLTSPVTPGANETIQAFGRGLRLRLRMSKRSTVRFIGAPPWRSVIARQQRRDAAICLGDDPHLPRHAYLVGRENPGVGEQADGVGRGIVDAHLGPVAVRVPLQELLRRFPGILQGG